MYFLLVIHVLVAIATVLVILMQSSKGSGLDSTLGGAAGQVLGGQAAPEMLKKLTRILVAVFFILCIVMAFQKGGQSGSKSGVFEKLQNEGTAGATSEENLDLDLGSEGDATGENKAETGTAPSGNQIEVKPAGTTAPPNENSND